MSDRLKFRAWDEADGLHRDEPCMSYDIDPRCDATVIMQCTGLKDKNGVLIFEGDIVSGVILSDGSEHIGRVLFDYNGYRIVTELKSVELCLTEKINVIGNIHQHPHLLGKEQ